MQFRATEIVFEWTMRFSSIRVARIVSVGFWKNDAVDDTRPAKRIIQNIIMRPIDVRVGVYRALWLCAAI